MRTENKRLREKTDALVRRLFGAQSAAKQKLDRAQLLLMLQGLDVPGAERSETDCRRQPEGWSEATSYSPEPVTAENPRRSTAPSPPQSEKRRGPRRSAELPVVDEVIDPEPVKACPEAWRCIGKKVTEQPDYEPEHFFKRHIVRRKYVRRDHPYAAPILALLDTLQDRGNGAPGLLAAVIVAEYCDHLTLYRQEQIFAVRHRVRLPRQTMAQ